MMQKSKNFQLNFYAENLLQFFLEIAKYISYLLAY